MDGPPLHEASSFPNCAARGERNAADTLFCTRCTAPVAVAALHELDESDLRLCRAALFDVLAEVHRSDTVTTGRSGPDESLWRAYLSAFWLRPETALVLYAQARAVNSLDRPAHGPSLDLGSDD